MLLRAAFNFGSFGLCQCINISPACVLLLPMIIYISWAEQYPTILMQRQTRATLYLVQEVLHNN